MVTLFLLLIQINIMLGVFNLIPIPPLDGSRVLFWWLEDKRSDIVQWLERYGMFVLFGLVYIFGGVLSTFFDTIYDAVLTIIIR
jgi:Zn-dependent protease